MLNSQIRHQSEARNPKARSAGLASPVIRIWDLFRCSSSGIRVCIVAAHPDDEVIGAGAQLRRWPQAQFIHVTDGAPRDLRDAQAAGCASHQEYAQVRRRELMAATSLAGITPNQLHELAFADQEASLWLVELVESLLNLLSRLGPEVVLTHPYEGGHPDHDATAFAVQLACNWLENQTGKAPFRLEMSSYHSHAGMMVTGEFLPCANHCPARLELTEAERALKQRMFDCFVSQRKVLGCFRIARESFRAAPQYDFTRPPHEGALYYEQFEWGMTGERWRELAGHALRDLGCLMERGRLPPHVPGFTRTKAAPLR